MCWWQFFGFGDRRSCFRLRPPHQNILILCHQHSKMSPKSQSHQRHWFSPISRKNNTFEKIKFILTTINKLVIKVKSKYSVSVMRHHLVARFRPILSYFTKSFALPLWGKLASVWFLVPVDLSASLSENKILEYTGYLMKYGTFWHNLKN